ncbi:GNAT family N-acetyltransferase [Paenibacillus sp. sgz500958]|uniref:GNAT family N-acetyltransferase n=1 Tax=Paenibacillus sp. sgz500958 TaxID=3242475 RepID=UPI0036D3BC4A
MQIRVARTEDIKDLKNLYWELDSDAIVYQPALFTRTERPDDFLTDIIKNEKADIIVIEEDARIIGFSLVQEKENPKISCLKEKKFVYVLDFVITEKCRNHGFGTQLLEATKEWGKKRGLDFLRLSVFEDNVKGQDFYRRNGLMTTMKTMECDL